MVDVFVFTTAHVIDGFDPCSLDLNMLLLIYCVLVCTSHRRYCQHKSVC